MLERLLIRGGLLIDSAQNIEAKRDILIEDGKVKAVFAPLDRRVESLKLSSFEIFDAKGFWVTPGLIDMHVHFREPGGELDETLKTGAVAAARGGFTTVLAMPNTNPPVDNVSLINFLRTKARNLNGVNILFTAAVTLGLKGEQLSDFYSLARAGASAFTDDGSPVMNAQLMRRALENTRDAGSFVISHCEDLNLSAEAPLNEGLPALRKGIAGSPWAGETVMVLRDIALSELTGARVHIAHVSSAQSVRALREAKKRGLLVTAEAAPHHFALSDNDIPGRDSNFKMNPPLRDHKDLEAVKEGLHDGTLDVIATDHAPHRSSKKSAGIFRSPFGVIGLETSLALALTHLVHKKILTPKQLIERMSAGPAKILGLKNKGTLKVGSDGDVTVIEPNASWTVKPPFASKSSNSPFVGRKLKGRVRATIIGGRIIFDGDR
jgi:dihydroorotase